MTIVEDTIRGSDMQVKQVIIPNASLNCGICQACRSGFRNNKY